MTGKSSDKMTESRQKNSVNHNFFGLSFFALELLNFKKFQRIKKILNTTRKINKIE